MDNQLSAGLGPGCVHLRVDCQCIFAEETDWHMPWMRRVLPVITGIVERRPAQTIFTRFIPAERPGQGWGTWRRYYERWPGMTIDRIGREMIQLVPELRRFVPPAEVIDKHVYSPWIESELPSRLRARGADTLVITGGETDVCVLASVLGAVDHGYRVIVVSDALCSSSDAAHEASLGVYHQRYSQQVETAPAEQVLAAWK